MKTEHPITPPQWQVDAWCKQALAMGADVDAVFLAAVRWGADQELEACCEWLLDHGYDLCSPEMRKDRRPKPLSLKERALAELDLLKADATTHGLGFDAPAIRRALEALPDV